MRAVRLLAAVPPVNAGEIAGYPDAVAASLVERGAAEYVDDGPRPSEIAMTTPAGERIAIPAEPAREEPTPAAAGAPPAADPLLPELDGMTLEQLRAECAKRRLDADQVPGTGKRGRQRPEDLRAAIRAHVQRGIDAAAAVASGDSKRGGWR